jgi:hypothetical protein
MRNTPPGKRLGNKIDPLPAELSYFFQYGVRVAVERGRWCLGIRAIVPQRFEELWL